MTGAAIAVLSFAALYAIFLAVCYRERCAQLEEQIRRMGGEPEPEWQPPR